MPKRVLDEGDARPSKASREDTGGGGDGFFDDDFGGDGGDWGDDDDKWSKSVQTSDKPWLDGKWDSQSGWEKKSGISSNDVADIKQWQGCTKVGTALPGTYLVPVKTPLEGWLEIAAREAGLLTPDDRFRKADLIRMCKDNGTPIGAVIDLVNTTKYYKGFSKEDGFGIEYKKIPIPGHQVPTPKDVMNICNEIDGYLKKRKSKDLHVALHCTHGLNRTGFFATAYLLLRTKGGKELTADQAIDIFEKARGTKMDKDYLKEAIAKIVASKPKPKKT